MEGLSDRGSTPLTSTIEKACDCCKSQAFLLLFGMFCAEKLSRSIRGKLITPKFTPYRVETCLIRASMRFWDSLRMVLETAA